MFYCLKNQLCLITCLIYTTVEKGSLRKLLNSLSCLHTRWSLIERNNTGIDVVVKCVNKN